MLLEIEHALLIDAETPHQMNHLCCFTHMRLSELSSIEHTRNDEGLVQRFQISITS